MKSDLIQNLFDDIRNILVLHRCEKWSNNWTWDKNFRNIKYYYLIFLEQDDTFHYKTFHYKDIENFSIELELYNNIYRIDIRDEKQDTHNWWNFKEEDFLIVETYIKELIKHQYYSIEKFSTLINLSENAYGFNKPDDMYYKMNIKLRQQKLQKLNENSNL